MVYRRLGRLKRDGGADGVSGSRLPRDPGAVNKTERIDGMTEGGFKVITPEQRAVALEKARQSRARRAEVKKEIAAGNMKFSDLLEMDDDAIRKTKVLDLIRAFPGYGPVKAKTLMEEIGIGESRRLGGLGIRQKEKLIGLLG